MSKLNPQLVGEAGVHYVISQLTMRGLIAVATSRNVKGPDVIVTNPDGTKFAAIQVKTRRATSDKFWNVGEKGLKWGGRSCWYAFVRIKDDQFSVLMAPASEVKRYAKADVDEMARKGTTSFGASWGYGVYFVRLMKDKHIEGRARRRWESFARDWVPQEEKKA